MSRRRAERQQERDDFLQQFEDLITYKSRIGVTAQGEEFNIPAPDNQIQTLDEKAQTFFLFDATLDGAPAPVENIIEEVAQDFTLIREAFGLGFDINATSPVPPDVHPQNDALLTLTENGIGIASFEELEAAHGAEGDIQAQFVGEDAGGIPDGFDTISEGETLEVFVSAPKSIDERGLSFGIDFTATGRGAVEITLFGEDVTTETFDLPVGSTGALNFEVDAKDGKDFDFAEVTVTGSAEISIIGIDLETRFDPANLLIPM